MARASAPLLLFAALAEASPSDAPPAFRLELLPKELAEERGAQCLDHSPAGYYIREQDPSRWVVFLEGGGLCLETLDCAYRAARTARGSSRFWEQNITPEDNHMLTAVSPLNPFANWSHVYVPYCSGDTWLGTSKSGHVGLLGLQMSGHLILETVLDRLANVTAIARSSDLVFGGTSAGGIGAFHHADWFAAKMARLAAGQRLPAPRLAVVPIEGVFFPAKFPVLFPEFALGIRKSVDVAASKYIANLFGPIWLHEGCEAAAKAQGFDRSSCFDISVMAPFIKARLFVISNVFDRLMIHDVGMCLDCSMGSSAASLSGRYIRFFGRLMRDTLEALVREMPGRGLFASSELHHDENWVEIFTRREKQIGGETLGSALERWYLDRDGGDRTVELLEPGCGEASDGPCADASEGAERDAWGEEPSLLE